jgi:hypothetical protein
MINLIQPSMALNARNATPTPGYDVPGPIFSMWNTWQVTNDKAPSDICSWVAAVAGGAPDFGGGAGGVLNNLVINCHGHVVHLTIGTGINFSDVSSFNLLSGLVKNIWITACQFVSFTGPGDGNLFCGALAKSVSAYVYASDADQDTFVFPALPYAFIDGYEGNVWKWHPDGSNEPVNPSGIQGIDFTGP